MANNGSFKKGEKKPNQGKRGPGKVASDLRKMVHEALDQAGGIEYLKLQSVENPTAFLSLLGKVIPKEVNSAVTVEGGLVLIPGKNV